jgi:hypothetical protein
MKKHWTNFRLLNKSYVRSQCRSTSADSVFSLAYAIACSIRSNPKENESLGFVFQQIRLALRCGGMRHNG